MDFREMLYITTIADSKSVTAAAKKLYISQPSLSSVIAKVEQDVGVQLFNRKNYPLTLTYAGEKYVEAARKILLLNDNLRRELIDVGLGKKGRIKFGIPTERAGYMLSRVLPRFKEEFPEVEVHILEAKSVELLEALQKDEINFLVLPRDKEDLPEGFETELIYKEQLYVVASEKEKAEGKLSLMGLRNLPFIYIKRGHSIRKKVDGILKKHKITPKTALEVTGCISATQMADAGLGYTIVPERALNVLGGPEKFCCIPYGEKEERWDVNVIYKEEIYLDRAERYMIDLMKKVFGEEKEEK